MNRCSHILFKVLISGFSLLGTASTVSAVQISRGPYLQQSSASAITIRWRSDAAHIGRVFYGKSQGALINSIVEPGAVTNHELRLTGLDADTTYFYSIHNGANLLAGGSEYFFQTAPNAGSAHARRIWIIGDGGTADANAAAVYNAYRTYTGSLYTDLMLMLGDNAYNYGTDEEYQNAVFEMYPEILRQTPLFSCYSNHDGYSADSATQTGPYYDIFTLPKNGECGGIASGTEAHYSFNFGDIHFVCLDSFETDRATNSAMHVWLEQDLAANTSKWLVAFWHHPPFSKGSHDSDSETELIDMRENFLPLLESAGVDLVLAGHSHLYERSKLIHDHYGDTSTYSDPVYAIDSGDGNEAGDGAYVKLLSGPDAGKGTVYIVAGSSGKTKPPDFPDEFPHPAMFTSLIELGSVVMDVAGNRMDLAFLDESGVVRDSLTLLKLHPDQVDSDRDGLPDAWEQLHFNNPTNAQSNVDVDQDGLDNLSEYIAGTNPDDPNSVLALNSITPSGESITISWYSESNRSYTIWRSANLLTNDWSVAAEGIPASPPVNWVELATDTNSAIYYRVDGSMVP